MASSVDHIQGMDPAEGTHCPVLPDRAALPACKHSKSEIMQVGDFLPIPVVSHCRTLKRDPPLWTSVSLPSAS